MPKSTGVQTQSSGGNISPRNPGEKSGVALSDVQGNFTLQGLAAKNLYQLEVRAKTYQTLTTSFLPVSAQLQQVALYRGTSLSGQVVDGAKLRPLGGIELEARAEANQARSTTPIRCITDDAGNFQFNLVPPGLYIITGRSTENPADGFAARSKFRSTTTRPFRTSPSPAGPQSSSRELYYSTAPHNR